MAKILVIEDEKDFLETICRLLELEGYETIKATDGKTGIEWAQRERPDLILCDYLMPGKNGFQVIDERNQSREMSAIPFIFLSVFDDAEKIAEGFDLGAQDYISKTTDNRIIIARIKAHLAYKEKGKILKLVDIES